MASILENKHILDDIYSMTVSGASLGKAGQFYMLRREGALDPLLGRPISLFDCDENEGTLTFLYQAIGRGTRLFASMREGDDIDVQGPYGNGFTLLSGDATLIGGGIGIAPLYLLARSLIKRDPARKLSIRLGYRERAYMADMFCALCSDCSIKLGGTVLDDVEFSPHGTYYMCGPEPMLMAGAKRAQALGATLYISMEAHMACGVGACLGCTCKTKKGNVRVCKEGPVFLASEVMRHE